MPESFNMKTPTTEVNDFLNNQFREVDWKNMSREQKIEFGEVAGMYYEPVVKAMLKNRYPDLTQTQIENISAEFMGSKSGGFAKLVASFDPAKYPDSTLSGFIHNKAGGVEVRLRKFVKFVSGSLILLLS